MKFIKAVLFLASAVLAFGALASLWQDSQKSNYISLNNDDFNFYS